MTPRYRFPLLVCISCAENVSSLLALTLMLLSIRLLQFAALLHIWDTARKAQTVVSGTCVSAPTIATAPAVDPSIVPYLILIGPAK